MTNKVFIFDCTGTKTGNLKGYKSVKSASKQINTENSKLHSELWNKFYEKSKTSSDKLVWTIKGDSN